MPRTRKNFNACAERSITWRSINELSIATLRKTNVISSWSRLGVWAVINYEEDFTLLDCLLRLRACRNGQSADGPFQERIQFDARGDRRHRQCCSSGPRSGGSHECDISGRLWRRVYAAGI